MVLYNVTSKLYSLDATPWEVWLLAAVAGAFLFILSLRPSETSDQNSQNIVLSVMAWVPIAFTALTSFAVDKMTAIAMTADDASLIETHTVYSFDLVGYIFGVFLIIAVLNTLRLVAVRKEFDSEAAPTRRGYEYEEYEADY